LAIFETLVEDIRIKCLVYDDYGAPQYIVTRDTKLGLKKLTFKKGQVLYHV
jgi:hypothetical protein